MMCFCGFDTIYACTSGLISFIKARNRALVTVGCTWCAWATKQKNKPSWYPRISAFCRESRTVYNKDRSLLYEEDAYKTLPIEIQTTQKGQKPKKGQVRSKWATDLYSTQPLKLMDPLKGTD